MDNDSSRVTSHFDNDVEKFIPEKDVSDVETQRHQEDVEEIKEEDEESRISNDQGRLRAPLEQIRSHSSARSARSHTDGYSHFAEEDHDDVPGSRERTQGNSKEFEVKFNGDDDPENPRSLPTWRKWTIVLIGSFCSLCVTCASALYTSTYTQMEDEYHIGRELATVGLTTYVCGLGLGPMFLGPLSEFYGRRIIYLCAFGGFIIWMIPCAVAPDIGSMLVCTLKASTPRDQDISLIC